jgi:pimeloyl-ACP methyl ester carboxylesterase
MTAIEPFTIDVADSALEDLRTRLSATRWPEPATTSGWEQGPPVDYLRSLCRYWADGYDWRAAESRLNRLPQFRTVIDGLGVHFAHVRSPHPHAVPLVMTHGWPGSFVEFERVMGPLADGSPPFHVVCPSLPGYAFSDKPAAPGWTVERIADAWAELMTRLGYEQFLAQGHDWGTSVSTALAQRHPARVLGLHLVPPLVAPDPATFGDLTDAERAALAGLVSNDDGYSWEHRTRPQTIGYALVDSPAALCGWIVEKFQAWSDCGGDLESVFTRDQLLDNLMLYWLPASGASAARLYRESFADVEARFRAGATDLVSAPVGASVFPKENPRPSRRWAARRFTDIRYWSEPVRGGHFAAFEQPELFVAEVQACFRALGWGVPGPGTGG